jgi:hypothetical protein
MELTLRPRPSSLLTALAGALLSLAVAGPAAAAPAISTPAPSTSSAAPTAMTPESQAKADAAKAADSARVADLEASVAALGKRAQEIDLALTGATTAYEAGQADLEAKQAQAAAAETRALAAEAKADAAKEVVGDFARNSYINPVGPGSAVVKTITDGDPTSAARGAELLAHVGRGNGTALTEANSVSRTAKAERKVADELRASADLEAKRLSNALTDVRKQAFDAAAELTAKVSELDVARLQANTSSQAATLLLAASGTGLTGASAGELCSAPAPSTYPTTDHWGGYSNGLIPESALCPIAPGHMLRWDAAAAFRALNAAYQLEFGTPLCVTDSYRSYAAQVDVFARKPGLAAKPGTSNHGWALAVDYCGGIQSFGTAQFTWMKANAPFYGWFHPDWAEPGGSKPEAWHWEYGKL